MEEFLKPENVINAMDIYGNMKVADFGCGPGYCAIQIAQRLSQEGHVFALDIRDEYLEIVRREARLKRINNISTIKSNLEIYGGSHLKSSNVDVVIAANILHQADNKISLLKEAHRILKQNGKLVIAEWNPFADCSMGPAKAARVHKNELAEAVKKMGFAQNRKFSAGNYHYGLLFKKV